MTRVLFLSFLLMTTGVWDTAECSSGDGKSLWYGLLNQSKFLSGTFPKGFLWGAGTAAFSTEGSWDRDGKGLSVWDHFTHHTLGRGNISTLTADTASNSYVLWEKDIESLRYLGVKFYSFSISWPRIFPDGDATGQPNLAAVDHYLRLIGQLKALDLDPVVTLFHWDLPQILQEELGGWTNAKLVQIFANYAAFCFKTFGQDVRYWITIHNPVLIAFLGYGMGIHAPGVSGNPADPFIVAHNLIRAHAAAWHIYDQHFRPHQHGQISITLGSYWVEPFNGQATPANVELCQRSVEAVIGWFAEPIHGAGDYPMSLRSSHPGLVPNFTSEEKLWVRGTADFFSLAFGPDSVRAGRILARFGQTGALNLRKILGWIQKEYEDPPVLVAESSWFSDASVGVEDTVAIYLMKRFLNQVLQAVVVDHVKVFGYTAWSLVDGFEWNSGYSIRRGLFYIDFNQPEFIRVPKSTAKYYRQIIKDNGFLDEETEEDIDGHFPCNFQFGVADFILQVHLQPFSPQFTDPVLYRWNISGDSALHPVLGVTLRTRGSQCTDFLAIQHHIRLLEATGSSHYRFALDWPRLFPNGDILSADAVAVRYYRCMLTELHKKGISAVVTLYHPTLRSHTLGLPRLLYEQGGWMNTSTGDAFVDYATYCFQTFGTLVNVWITVNEPNRLIEAYNVSAEERDMVVRTVLMAHARAWKIYNVRFRRHQGAKISFALHADWVEPANPFVDSHTSAVQHFLFFELGRFLDPILQNIDYTDTKSCHGCFRMPRFSEHEMFELRGALDFIALNHFTTRLVYPKLRDLHPSSSVHDYGCSFMTDPTWETSYKGQAVVPWGLRRVLRWVKSRYGNSHPIIITATGIDDQASHNDHLRQQYIKTYMQEALKAHVLDGVDVRGFYVWKLQDHHTPDFGFFLSPNHQSRPKASVSIYRQLISQGGFPSISDSVTSACEPVVSQSECWICNNKPFLFFGMCVMISVSVLASVMVNGMIRRSRRKKRIKTRKKKMGQAMRRVAYRI
ncbi:hypothetical protein Q7C36_017108 [Tachysurus vachellii]|uniref:Beta-klotho n=1 Tax=Tachysurus vachellii TaxID=175792 RepID=A0AA88S744_TACVA|nr:hypothetical protein Q7C36_017108 [Tachysurus vachellii]